MTETQSPERSVRDALLAAEPSTTENQIKVAEQILEERIARCNRTHASKLEALKQRELDKHWGSYNN